MQSNRSNNKKSSQAKAPKTAQSTKLWNKIDEKKEENVNGGCYPCYGYYNSYYYYY